MQFFGFIVVKLQLLRTLSAACYEFDVFFVALVTPKSQLFAGLLAGGTVAFCHFCFEGSFVALDVEEVLARGFNDGAISITNIALAVSVEMLCPNRGLRFGWREFLFFEALQPSDDEAGHG